MVKISYINNSIIIEGGENDQIYDWQCKMFLKISCGYDFDEKRKKYVFSDKQHLHDILFDTINYFSEENINYSLDDGIKKLVKQFTEEQKEFEESLKIGLDITHSSSTNETPPGFIRTLDTHQLIAYKHLLAVKHGANFSVPGSGKTSVIYAVLDSLRMRHIVEKILVIGPRSCFSPWEDEAVACFGYPIKSARLTGTKKSRFSLYLQANDYELLLCTYQTATNDNNEIIKLCKKYNIFVVIDESHNIKRFDGGKWSEAILSISRYAVRRAILSGTPIPNDFYDLWTQFTFLWPGRQVLGDKESFRYKIEAGQDEEIINSVKPFFYRVTKSQLNLPEPEFIREEVVLEPYQQKIYTALSTRYLQELKVLPDELRTLREWRKAKIVRLIQTASNPTLLAKYSQEFDIPSISGEGTSIIDIIDEYPKYETPVKIRAAQELIIQHLEKGEKTILWSSFILNIQMLKKILADFDPLCIYGAIPKDESENTELNREQQIKEFKLSKTARVLLANPAACAESISLHKICHNAIYLDRTFNCGQYLQSLDRIHRIGLSQDERVTYHLLIARNTIDETIDRRLLEKEKRMKRLLDDDIPIGSFQAEDYQMTQSEEEENIDFQETINDIQKQLEE